MNKLVSIITPFYNAENYLAEAIHSVLDQDYKTWELILVNDGSTDRSKAISTSFNDSRIIYFEQANKGVSAARNIGLNAMKGDFFCFLDADDTLTKASLSSRVEILESDSSIYFVDGAVEKWNAGFSKQLFKWTPVFEGSPLHDLISLSGKSFFGPSWLVRRAKNISYKMKEGLTHGEDLLFYIGLSLDDRLKYTFTEETVLKYRIHSGSAMRGDLQKLEDGYLSIHKSLKRMSIDAELIKTFRHRVKLIMFKSYLRRGHLWRAVKALV